MNTNRYCKHCGAIVPTEYGKTEYVCPECGKEVQLKDLLAGWTRDARIDQLKAMHELMLGANDEGIYMSWIVTGVPDCPSEEDFEFIALRDESYNECFDLFLKLIKRDGNRW